MATAFPIVPWPEHLVPGDGRFVIDERARIVLSDPADPALRRLAGLLVAWVRAASGVELDVATAWTTAWPGDSVPAFGIAILLDSSAAENPEGYPLRAATPAGVFYGLQTLRQLLPVDAESDRAPERPRFRIELPAVDIADEPRFVYRGLHLDVGRHMFPVDFIKKHLDLMALYKLNRFHWHLTEDQGWRLEIRRYPRLTEVGAYRRETLIGRPRENAEFDGRRYGGFYTQEQVRDVVQYAAERYITVVPEIEMPGHSLAALAAYPELACTDGPFEVGTRWGVFDDIYCPSERTFEFLENVLTEVIALFPGEYVHIGGDEAPKRRWEESALAQEIIRREGLRDEHELQSWFLRRIERFLNERGRRLVGWDEIVEGGLSPTATVMFWRDWAQQNVPRMAAAQGNDLIMTPNGRLYLDHYQGPPEQEPLAIGGLTTLEQLYAYEPVPADFTADEAQRVLGAQGNVWTEYMTTSRKVEYMVFPRALALAEVVWSPAAARNWQQFTTRLPAQFRRLDALDVNYRDSERTGGS
jgi:hexosaminidase